MSPGLRTGCSCMACVGDDMAPYGKRGGGDIASALDPVYFRPPLLNLDLLVVAGAGAGAGLGASSASVG